jgi:flagellar biosynthesis protein FliQ
MSPELPGTLFRESLVVLGTVGAPLFLALLGVGLLVGILQAATQVNDPAVGALPRLIAAGAVAFMLGGWMMGRLATFFASSLERMAERPF